MKNLKIKYIPIILFGVIVVFGCQKHKEQYYNEGYNQYISGDYKAAIESYTKCIESKNNEKYKSAAINYRAFCYLASKQYQLALSESSGLIEKTSKSDDDLGTYYLCRSDIYYEMKKYNEAISDINSALKYNLHYETRVYAILKRATYKYASGDFIGAKVDSFIVKKNYTRHYKTIDEFKMDLLKKK
jgi:tetratricopeptide (TPR) repeat protein